MKVKKILPLGLVVVIGMVFMLGSVPTEEMSQRPSVNEHNLNLNQKIELKKLRDELSYWKEQQILVRDSYETLLKRDQRNQKVVNGVTQIQRSPTTVQTGKDLHKIQQIIKHKESQIDKIARESQKSCFPKETQVLLSDGSLKAIGALQKGDSVTVYDIATDSISVSAIDEVFIDTNNHYYVLNGTVKATAYERFLTKEGWKRIRYIQKGDAIFDGNSYQNVESIEKIHVSDTVYNLSIKDNHNFFVSHDGSTPMLVHNTPSGGGGSSGGGSGGGSSK
jgi:hypothetical protein